MVLRALCQHFYVMGAPFCHAIPVMLNLFQHPVECNLQDAETSSTGPEKKA